MNAQKKAAQKLRQQKHFKRRLRELNSLLNMVVKWPLSKRLKMAWYIVWGRAPRKAAKVGKKNG